MKRALVAEHRKAQEQFAKAQGDGRKLDALKAVQAQRRAKLEGEREALRERQRTERAALERAQLVARRELQGAYLARVRQVKAARAEAKPRGLAAFLGRVTGVSLILGELHRHQDARAYEAFVEQKMALAEAQRGVALLQQREHELHALEMDRQLKALARVDARDQRSLGETRVREQRVRQRAGHDHMPALTLELKPRGRGASVRKAAGRYRDSLRGQEDRQPRRSERGAGRDIDLNEAMTRALAAQTPISSPVDVSVAFARAAGGETSGTGGGGGDEGGAAAKPVSWASRRGERDRESKRGDDFERES